MKKVTFKVNSVPNEFIVDEKTVLIDLLRKDLHLTGTKQSCDRKGQCGACTVIVNGKTALSCTKKVVDLEGADIITIEGLGTPDNPHLIQEAFVLAGAIQCGFCTPGMIMAAKALLDVNKDPSVDDIKKALKRNLCRCTGYKSIIEAIQLAGKFLRGETTPDKVRPAASGKKIGVSHPRPWSMNKACGAVRYTDDILIPGALEVAVTRSPHHNAKIISIDYSTAEKMPGVVGVMTAADIKGTNSSAMIVPDEPVLCADLAPVMGAPIAAVIAETREQARAAAAAVKVEYEVLPRISTPAEALAEGAPQVFPDPNYPNEVYTVAQIRGDSEKALGSSAHVIEDKFSVQLVHQACLEPEAALACLDGEGDDAQLVVIGRSISIHMHVGVLAGAIGWDNLRYVEAYAGGQFGIKMDLTTEPIAAAAAVHFRRPVRYVATLEESLMMTPKRHPYSMDVKLGADANGKITAYDIDFTVDNGAHTSVGLVIMDRSIEMLSGCYDLPNVKAAGRLVYTNDAWGGAARGAGPPQVNFALESAIDMMAAKMKIDPWEFRMKNAVKPGGCTSSGQVVDQWEYNGCLERMKPLYEKACKEAKAHTTGDILRGVGLAGSSFGVGSAGDVSCMAVELDPDDGLTVYGAVAEPGEGNDAMLTQIASHCMDIPMNKIRLSTRDSEIAPDAGVSASSRQTYMSGGALVKAIGVLKAAMKEAGAKTHADLVKAGKPTRYMGKNILTEVNGLDKETGQGDAWESFIHGSQMAEVEVNAKTGEVKIVKMTTVVDPGTIINPQAVLGQVEGGADMGAGYALREHFVMGKSKDWLTYKFPTISTQFDQETILLETPRARGPLGATGVGEFTLVATHPAIANAVYNATGVRFHDLPITPEKVLAALGNKK
ncbi:MAG: molybdopterin-dependent oxidoreductase [Spirochaetes bacterium]|nr:molybdopterin-dependent oxidoreductase [Spirochaetota bacterium]